MRATREQIVTTARTWEGTPWQHQGMLKGPDGGADCEGFIEGVARECGFVEVIDLVRDYRRVEDGSLMLTLLEKYLDFVTGNVTREVTDISRARPADILAFCDEALRRPDVPRHLGIYTGERRPNVPYVIHAGSKDHGVVEHRMSRPWLKRVHSIWSLRGLGE